MEQVNVLYEDNHLIAVLKPAGIAIEPGGRGENLLDLVKSFLKEKYNKQGNVFLGIVHRLDQPVSGVVVFAKTSKGASRLSEQFRNGAVSKKYHALVAGYDIKDSYFEGNISKNSATRKATVGLDGKEAKMKYAVIKKCSNNQTLLEVDLLTGRFHQIRSVLASMNCPIVGDIKYGSLMRLPNQEIALRSVEIAFKLATEDKNIIIRTEPAWWETELCK